MKIVTVVGARFNLFTSSQLEHLKNSLRLKKSLSILNIIDANMSNVFFEELHIPMPHYNLNINSLSHAAT